MHLLTDIVCLYATDRPVISSSENELVCESYQTLIGVDADKQVSKMPIK